MSGEGARSGVKHPGPRARVAGQPTPATQPSVRGLPLDVNDPSLSLGLREWKNGSNSSYNYTPFLHSLRFEASGWTTLIRGNKV